MLQLACFVERVSSDFGEEGLTGAVFLVVVKVFDAVWVSGLLYRLTVLNFPLYIVKLIYSYLFGWTFKASFQSATSTGCGMWTGMAWGGVIFLAPSSLYVNNMRMPPCHIELAVSANHTAVIATSHQPAVLVSYLVISAS